MNALADHLLALPLAAGFAAPGLALAGLALASVPIIIHILNRRRYKVHRWAAMQYLLEAMRRNRRRLQFENWFLMALRCCALLLAGFALARPMGCSESATARALGQSSRLHVIVIDNSASAAYRIDEPQSRTVFERGRAVAGELVTSLRNSRDAVAIVPLAGGEGLPTPSYDLDAAKGALAKVPQRFVGGNLAEVLRETVKIGREATGFTSKRLYLVTDGARSLWQEPASVELLREIGPQLAGTFDVVHIDVGEKSASNASVDSVRVLGSIVTSSMPADFAAQARSYSGSSAALIWRTGGRILGSSGTLALAPDTPEKVLPQVAMENDGPAMVSATLDPQDRLSEDDQRAIAFTVRKRLNVLVAEGERGTSNMESPGTFLQLALSPTGGEADAVKVEVAGEAELSARPLGQRDAVILAAPAGVSEGEATQLQGYVNDGGTLIVFMGEGVNTDMCNRILWPKGLLPGKVLGIASLSEGQEPFRLDFRPDSALHPLLRIFRGEQSSGLATARLWAYARVELDQKLSAQRVLDVVGGDPAITMHSLGKGKVVFCAASADTRWTTLPAKPAFVAMLHEVLLGTVNAGDAWMNRPAGSRLDVPRRVVQSERPTLSDPTGHLITLEPTSDGEVAFRSEVLEQPGVYRLQVNGNAFPVAVAFPAGESDLTHIDAAGVRRALGDIEIRQEERQVPAELTSAGEQSDFSWPLMLTLLGLLGAEAFVAMLFRH